MPTKRRSAPAKETTHSEKTVPGKAGLPFGLTTIQLGILAGLSLILCAIVGTSAGLLLLFNLNRLTRTDEVAAATPEATSSRPSATPAPPTEPPPEPSVTATPAIRLPEAQPTPEPSATATYAVAPSFINKDKIA